MSTNGSLLHIAHVKLTFVLAKRHGYFLVLNPGQAHIVSVSKGNPVLIRLSLWLVLGISPNCFPLSLRASLAFLVCAV